jgi:hypothetical protein
VIYKKRGSSECFPSKIVGRASRLYMPEYDVVVVSEGGASVSPEVANAVLGALRKSASSSAKPAAQAKRGSRRRSQG